MSIPGSVPVFRGRFTSRPAPAFNSSNQFCTTTMPTGALRSRATFSLIIKKPLAVRRHVVVTGRGERRGVAVSNSFAGLAVANVAPDVCTGTALSVFTRST